MKNGKTDEYKFNGIGRVLDDALEAVEKDNPKLKNVLVKDYARLQIDSVLPSLIDLIAGIPFHHETLKAKDILGHVYEYFLGEFAIAEGKKGGQYYTPKSIVTVIVEMLQPFKGRVYDPCCGSGGFFVQSEKFIQEHGGRIGQISVYGQESNPTTWRLASINMAIRGMDFDFGKEPANSFTRDQHPDLRADYVMANPPFNMKEWKDGVADDDVRWKYGVPPASNANFAWLQHMVHHLFSRLVRGHRCLLKLHGDADDAQTYILTKNQYLDAYREPLDFHQPLPKALRQIFISNSLLFLGCSLDHDWSLEPFKKVKDQSEYEIPNHFALLPESGSLQLKQEKETLLLGLNVQPIWYPEGQHEYIEKLLQLVIDVADKRMTLEG